MAKYIRWNSSKTNVTLTRKTFEYLTAWEPEWMNRAFCHTLTCVAAFRISKTTCCHTHCRSMRAASVVGSKLTEGTFHVTRLSLCSHESRVMSVKKCTMFVEFIASTSTFFTSFQLYILPMAEGRQTRRSIALQKRIQRLAQTPHNLTKWSHFICEPKSSIKLSIKQAISGVQWTSWCVNRKWPLQNKKWRKVPIKFKKKIPLWGL